MTCFSLALSVNTAKTILPAVSIVWRLPLFLLVTMCREHSTHGHHQIVNTEMRLIIFFAAKDGEALYSQRKQDRELEVRNRFKGLDPMDRVPEELWMEVHDIVQEAVSKTIPKEKGEKKGKIIQ